MCPSVHGDVFSRLQVQVLLPYRVVNFFLLDCVFMKTKQNSHGDEQGEENRGGGQRGRG
jgi:hypothetical protein